MANERCTKMHGFARFWPVEGSLSKGSVRQAPFDRLRAGRRPARECAGMFHRRRRAASEMCGNVQRCAGMFSRNANTQNEPICELPVVVSRGHSSGVPASTNTEQRTTCDAACRGGLGVSPEHFLQ